MREILLIIGILLSVGVCWVVGVHEEQWTAQTQMDCKHSCDAQFWNYNCQDMCDEFLTPRQDAQIRELQDHVDILAHGYQAQQFVTDVLTEELKQIQDQLAGHQ